MFERIKLFSCNGLKYDLHLLYHHIEHYLNYGILPENFLLVFNTPDQDDWRIGHAKEVCKNYGIVPKLVWVGEYASQELHEIRSYIIRHYTKDNDWVIHCDADEFHWYHKPIDQMILETEKNNANCIQGVFTDRITKDGSLPDISPAENIYDQFPVLANLNNIWFEQNKNPPSGVVKMMAYQKHLMTTRGGHQIAFKKGRYAFGIDLCRHKDIMQTDFRESCPYQVHHFKWHSGIIPKLKQRIETYKRRGFSWWFTSQRCIDSLNNNKIPLEMVDLYENQTSSLPVF